MSAPDPFALGGPQADDNAILAAFLEWIEAVRATDARKLSEDELEAAGARDSERMIEIAEMPISGTIGLAVKMYLALRSRDGGAWGDDAALWPDKWTSGYNATYVEMAIAEDLSRFVPELAPLIAKAYAAGRAALYEDDEGGAA
jgi:hypothetical protein